jgi:hypothetical protein
MARTRFQSVLDAFEEDRFFITGSSTKRDYVNSVGGLGVKDRNRHTTKKPERYEAPFPVVEPIVFECERRTFKDPRCVQEVEAMLFQIRSTLSFVPPKAHMRMVYTMPPPVKAPRKPTASARRPSLRSLRSHPAATIKVKGEYDAMFLDRLLNISRSRSG